MRSPNLIFIALLFLPSSSFAFPHPVQGVIGPNGGVSSSTAGTKAALRPSTSRTSDVAPESPAPAANVDANPALAAELPKAPPEGELSLMQQLQKAWTNGRALASKAAQSLLTDLSEAFTMARDMRLRSLDEMEQDFWAFQEAEAAQFASDQEAALQEHLRASHGENDSGAAAQKDMDFFAKQAAEIEDFKKHQAGARESFQKEQEDSRAAAQKVDDGLQSWVGSTSYKIGGVKND